MQSQNLHPAESHNSMQSQNFAPAHSNTPVAPVMSTGDWFVTQLLLAIPLVNIVLLLVWGFGSSGNPNRRNFCKATMIWFLIGIVLSVIYMVIAAVFISAGNF